MKKIYSFLMALSIVLCANANSFEAAKSLEISMARPQVSKKVNVTPSQVATPVINKTIQVKKQALNAQQQERMAIARQAQSAPAVKVNGVRQIEAVPTAAKQAIPTNVASKAPAKAAAEATDTVEIVATTWVWKYYEADNDWFTTLVDATETYEIKLDYVSDTQAGTFTEDDCLMDYTGMYINGEDDSRTIVTFTEVDIVVTDDENGLTLHAELLSTDNVLYIVDAHIAPLPEPKGNVELAYVNAELVDATLSSSAFQFSAFENDYYTSIFIYSDQVVGEYETIDMYDPYYNYIAHVDGADTTFVDFLDLHAVVTIEGKTYNLVADVLGSDTIMYHITMSYTKPDPTDTIDIVATNLYIDEFEFWGMVFTTATASNDEYEVTFDLSIALEEGEYATEDFNASYCGIVRTSDMAEIAMTEISATVTGEGGDRVIKAEVVGNDNVLYNMDLSYVVPEATDTVQVVFDELASAEYYSSSADYYIVNQNENFIVTLDIFEEKGNLMGEYSAEDFDLYYTQLGVIADGDTTVVTIADAKAVVTATEEEGIVLIEAELTGMDAVLYKISTKADVADKGLEYDATEGFLIDEYTTEDIYTINDQSANGYIMFDVEAADGSDLMGLVFWVDGADENTIIPTGTYQINGTGEAGTVLASTGMGAQGLTYSLYATMEDGYIVPPCWFMTGGEVVVTEEDGVLKIAVDAVNSNNLIIYVTCEYNLNTQQGLPYDATEEEGALNRTYGAEDQVFFTTDFLPDFGMLFVDVMPADNSEILCVGFMADEIDSQITITPGTYEISASGEIGTAMASTGLTEDGYITESYFATLTADGYLTTPLYYLVSGTVVVENVDGQFKMTVDAVNSNGIPVHVVYDPTATSGNDKTPLQYDATEGAVDRSYTTEEITINKGEGYFQVLAYAADGTDMTGLLIFGQEDENTIIPVGTYEINATEAEGTVLASEGVSGNSITLSFYGETNPQGQIYVPCWFMVEGTVVVTAADGKLNIEVNALNSYDVPVHIVMEYDLNTKQGLQYDMQEGSLNVVYTDNDNVEVNTEYVAEDGVIYLNIDAADGSNTISVAFFAEAADPVIGIPAGTYEINDTQDYGTVMSSPGVQGGYIYPSFYGNMNAQGQITIPCYFMVSGQVVVENIENHLKVTIDALNSYDVPAHIVYEADPVGSAVENVTVDTTNASKVIEKQSTLYHERRRNVQRFGFSSEIISYYLNNIIKRGRKSTLVFLKLLAYITKYSYLCMVFY